MSRWFRFYDDAVNDPKVQRLPGEKFKAWVNLLCLASKNDGVLPKLADIAFVLRMSDEKVSSLLNEFCEQGLIDPIEVSDAPMSYAPHNWDGRQFKSDVSNERVKRFRQRKCNVTVTPPDTEQIQKDAADAPPVRLTVVPATDADLEKSYFDRGKEVLGTGSGGLLAKLLTSKQKNVALARAAVEQASTKSNPREYIGAIIRGKATSDEPQWLDGIPGVI